MIKFLKRVLLYFIICFSYVLPNWFIPDAGLSHIPVQEAGRIKPMDTYARNQLLLFYGKQYIDADNNVEGERIEAIDWLISLLKNPYEELNREILYISNWSNSPEVETSLGLDSLNRESHR